MTRQEKAKKIIELVGGESNVKSMTHCVTRLRFNLADDKKADLATIKNLDGIMGAQVQGGQTQIIIGGEVGKVFKDIIKIYPNLSAEGTSDNAGTEKKSVFNRFLDTLTSILVPSLAPVVGGGMLKGFMFLFTGQGWLDAAGGTAMGLNIASDCMFYFFPFLLALSAAKRFKTNEYMALALAGAIMHPSIVKLLGEGVESIKFLGFIPIVLKDYGSSVVPIILSVWLLSVVYNFIEDKMPSMLTVIFTPLLTLIIVVPVSLFCLAPIGFYLGEYVAKGLDALINFAPWLAGFVISATRPFLVLTGMHHAIRPLSVQQISTYGSSTIGDMNFMSTMAQATAALAIFTVTKNKKMKQISMSATVSGFLGITEPALYSVLVKYKSAMIGAFLGGGLGGMIGAIFKAASYASVMPSIVSIPAYLGETSLGFFLGFITTLVSTFLITIFLSKSIFKVEDEDDDAPAPAPTKSKTGAKTYEIYSAVTGEVVPMKDVKDETFASEIVGKGIAVNPKEGRIVSPVDGELKTVFKTKHALGILTDDGIEILIHVGVNTVELEGKYFESKIEEGKRIKKGDLLLTFDKNMIEKEGYDPCVIMIVSNTNDYLSVLAEYDGGDIFEGERAITVVE